MKGQCYICPWQAGSLLTTSFRKLIHNPRRILSPYLSNGTAAIDVGCGNILPHQCEPVSLRLEEWYGKADFALVFWMLHEVPDSERLIREIFSALKESGKLLFVEPKGHVKASAFDKSLDMITAAGFEKTANPKIAFSRAALMKKRGG